MIEFFVPGRPITQGSLTAFANKHTGKMVYKSKDSLDPWRQSISLSAKPHFPTPLTGPITMCINWYFKQPKSNKDPRPTSKKMGDIDKLERAVLDALTGVAFVDDSQVCRVLKGKYWTDVSNSEGVLILMGEL